MRTLALTLLLVLGLVIACPAAAWAHSPQGIKVVGEITAWDAEARQFTVKDAAGTLWTFAWDAETHFTGPGPGAPGKRVTVRWWHEREHRDVLRATDVKFLDQSTR